MLLRRLLKLLRAPLAAKVIGFSSILDLCLGPLRSNRHPANWILFHTLSSSLRSRRLCLRLFVTAGAYRSTPATRHTFRSPLSPCRWRSPWWHNVADDSSSNSVPRRVTLPAPKPFAPEYLRNIGLPPPSSVSLGSALQSAATG